MLSETAFSQTHTHESRQRSRLQETAVGGLHTLEHRHRLGDKQLSHATECTAFVFQLTDADGYQCRNGIAHHWHIEIAEQPLRQRGQLEGEGGNLVPAADDARQCAHRQDGH